MSRYQGTLLPSGLEDRKTETETRKSVLDLLKKINEVYFDLFPVSGSTDTGNYTKFPDGTMIASTLLNLGTASQNWVYPVPFVGDNPIITSAPVAGTPRFCSVNNISLTSVDILAWQDTGATSTVSRGVMAVGRWKE